MSVRPRISVLRFRQLPSSIRQSYDASSRSTAQTCSARSGTRQAADGHRRARGAQRARRRRLMPVAGGRRWCTAHRGRPGRRPLPARAPRRGAHSKCGSARQRIACRRFARGGQSSSAPSTTGYSSSELAEGPQRETQRGGTRLYAVSARAAAIDREQSARRIERDIETLGGPGVHALRRGDSPLRVHTGIPPTHSTTFARELKAIGYDVGEDPLAPSLRATTTSRRVLRDPLWLRLEPQRRPVRRNDGCRHGSREWA